MAGLPSDVEAELRRTFAELRTARLPAAGWAALQPELARVAAAVRRNHADAVTAALLPVSRASFEGKVTRRLAGAGRPAALVVATKPTSALPVVGAVSAALLVGIGYLLGGGGVAVLTGLFALFIFAIALAGSRTTLERVDRRRAPVAARPTLERAPQGIVRTLDEVEAGL